MQEIDFSDRFDDILAKDGRYAPRAYSILMDVLCYLTSEAKRVSSWDIMDEFRATALSQYGAMSYYVLDALGIHSTKDLGEMVANLQEFRRIGRDHRISLEAFAAGYDFKEAFLSPYAV